MLASNQEHLATAALVSRMTIVKFESAKRNPTQLTSHRSASP